MTRIKVTYYYDDMRTIGIAGYYTEEKFFAKRENAEQWAKDNTDKYSFTYQFHYPKPKTYLPEFEFTDFTFEDE